MKASVTYFLAKASVPLNKLYETFDTASLRIDAFFKAAEAHTKRRLYFARRTPPSVARQKTRTGLGTM